MAEADLSQALRKRLYYAAPQVRLVGVPNAAKRTPWAVRQAKKEGMATGFPDLIAFAPGGLTAVMELKTPKGRLSENQAEWLEWLSDNGHPCAVIRSVEEGVAFLRKLGFPVREAAA